MRCRFGVPVQRDCDGDNVDGGATAGGKGSTIIELEPEPRIVREGAIPAAEILAVLDQEKV